MIFRSPLAGSFGLGTAPASATQEMAVMSATRAKAIAMMPRCTGQDCTKDQWRVPPPGIDAWLPSGIVRLFMGRVAAGTNYVELGMMLPFSAFRDANGNLKKDVQKVFSRKSIGPATYDYLVGTRWKGKRLDAKQKLETRHGLSFCTGWCRGCVTSHYPAGVPTCPVEVQISPGASWDVYAKKLANGDLHVALVRRDPSNYTKTLNAIGNTLDKAIGRICSQGPTALQFVPSPDPTTQVTTQSLAIGISNICGRANTAPAPPVIQLDTPMPVAPIIPPPQLWWDKKPVQVSIAVGVPLVVGSLAWALLRRR